MSDSRKITGELGEELARLFLIERGYKILLRNFHCPLGEIDLIAKERNSLIFVEVKARQSLAMGHPAEAVTPFKRRQIIKTAQYYLKQHGMIDWPCRFDVVSILFAGDENPSIELIQNAFGE